MLLKRSASKEHNRLRYYVNVIPYMMLNGKEILENQHTEISAFYPGKGKHPNKKDYE